jgi:Rad3-related DNA helicase
MTANRNDDDDLRSLRERIREAEKEKEAREKETFLQLDQTVKEMGNSLNRLMSRADLAERNIDEINENLNGPEGIWKRLNVIEMKTTSLLAKAAAVGTIIGLSLAAYEAFKK